MRLVSTKNLLNTRRASLTYTFLPSSPPHDFMAGKTGSSGPRASRRDVPRAGRTALGTSPTVPRLPSCAESPESRINSLMAEQLGVALMVILAVPRRDFAVRQTGRQAGTRAVRHFGYVDGVENGREWWGASCTQSRPQPCGIPVRWVKAWTCNPASYHRSPSWAVARP